MQQYSLRKKYLLIFLFTFFILTFIFFSQETSLWSKHKNISLASADTQSITLNILPLGDSITQGGNGYASYRRNLWFLLEAAGFNVNFIGSQNSFHGYVDGELKDFDLDHEGHWAWEAGELNKEIGNWLLSYTPNIVLFHAGTNDFDRGQSNESTILEFESIIAKLRARNSKVIILFAKIIPMKNKDTLSINQSIEALINKIHTSESPVVLVDQYADYEPLTDNHDTYHPNTKGENKIAKKWFDALIPYLKKTK